MFGAGVMQKQQAEENKEIQFLAAKQHEVVALEQQIRQKAEYQKKAGVELEATCQVGLLPSWTVLHCM